MKLVRFFHVRLYIVYLLIMLLIVSASVNIVFAKGIPLVKTDGYYYEQTFNNYDLEENITTGEPVFSSERPDRGKIVVTKDPENPTNKVAKMTEIDASKNANFKIMPVTHPRPGLEGKVVIEFEANIITGSSSYQFPTVVGSLSNDENTDILKTVTTITVNPSGSITLSNRTDGTTPVTISFGEWNSYKLVIDMSGEKGTTSLYLNGSVKPVATGSVSKHDNGAGVQVHPANIQRIYFNTMSTDILQTFYMDNIRIYTDDGTPQITAIAKRPGLESGELIMLASNIPGTTIRYTTDGTQPTDNSPIYSQNIEIIRKNTIIKAVGIDSSGNCGYTYTFGPYSFDGSEEVMLTKAGFYIDRDDEIWRTFYTSDIREGDSIVAKLKFLNRTNETIDAVILLTLSDGTSLIQVELKPIRIEPASSTCQIEMTIDKITELSSLCMFVWNDLKLTQPLCKRQSIYPISETEISNQRLSAKKLNEQIKTAIQREDNELIISPGCYRVGNTFARSIDINGANNLTLKGEDVYLIKEAQGDVLRVINSSNIAVEGFYIDSDPLTFTQGEIVGINQSERKFDVKIDPGYIIPNEEWVGSNVIFYNHEGTSQLFGRWNDGTLSIENIGGSVIRIKNSAAEIYEANLAEGCKVVIPRRRSGSALLVSKSKSCVFRDISIYSADGFGIEEDGGYGGHTYERIKITRKPGTTRLHSVSADGFHSAQTENGPIIKNCEIAYTQDDLVNIHGFMNLVYQVEDNRNFYMLVLDKQNFEVGSILKFYDMETMEMLGSASVVAYELIKNDSIDISTLQQEIRSTRGINIRSLYGNIYYVTLNNAVQISKYDIVETTELGGKNAVLQDSYLHDGCVRGILMRSMGGRIENNTFERISGPAIYINAERNWLEGPMPSGVMVTGNKIAQCGASEMGLRYLPGSIVVTMSSLGGAKRSFDNIYYYDIEITRNTITNAGGCGIFATNIADSLISENIIINPWSSIYGKYVKAGEQQCIMNPFYGIYVDVAENITVIKNSISSLPDWAEETYVNLRGDAAD